MWTEGEEGGVGDASLSAGETCGGVEESNEEPRGAASSESPEGGDKSTSRLFNRNINVYICQTSIYKLISCLMLQMFAPRCRLSPSAAITTEEEGLLNRNTEYSGGQIRK